MGRDSPRADRIRRLRRATRRSGTAHVENESAGAGRWAHRVGTTATALTALAAVAALLFTGISSLQARDELQLAQDRQITDRYNAAVSNLGHRSKDVRIGGIYALQRILLDSPRDQPALVNVLCAYVRAHTPEVWRSTDQEPIDEGDEISPVASDVQAALAVLRDQPLCHDGDQLIDLHGSGLPIADLREAHFPKAFLSGAHLLEAELLDANLASAELAYTVLEHADFIDADLRGAMLYRADLTGVDLRGADLTGAKLWGADLTGADLSDADLTGADLSDAKVTAKQLRKTKTYRGAILPAALRTAAR